MIKNKNNGICKGGFTLVELLAVIVVLAIILVIAVPKIMNTIEDARKGSFESSAKLIASQAERKALENETLGITGEIKCEDVAKLSSNDYEACTISIEDGIATVTIAGKGKFAGMNICNATKTTAEVVEGECPIIASGVAATIEDLVGTNGLTETEDGNVRYVGSNEEVKNYVEFGNDNELWRIIGVFEVETSSGKTEKLMKLVRNEFIGYYSWDSSASGVNVGYGINQWGASTYEDGSVYEGADLMILLNTLYLNQQSGNCVHEIIEACDFSETTTQVKGINSTFKNMIEEVVWHTGGFEEESMTPLEAYAEERPTEIGANGEGTGKVCTSGTYCNDTVERTIEWEGLVGLIYPSDYGFAGGTSCTDITSTTCGTSNWLNLSYGSYGYRTISPNANSSGATGVWYVDSNKANVRRGSVYDSFSVRPAVYLKSNVQITGDGDGSSNAPYKLSM